MAKIKYDLNYYLEEYNPCDKSKERYNGFKKGLNDTLMEFVNNCDGRKARALSAFCTFANKMAELSEAFGGVDGRGLNCDIVCNVVSSALERAHKITQEQYTMLFG